MYARRKRRGRFGAERRSGANGIVCGQRLYSFSEVRARHGLRTWMTAPRAGRSVWQYDSANTKYVTVNLYPSSSNLLPVRVSRYERCVFREVSPESANLHTEAVGSAVRERGRLGGCKRRADCEDAEDTGKMGTELDWSGSARGVDGRPSGYRGRRQW